MEPAMQFAIAILFGLWGAGLQMTGSKFAGIVIMAASSLLVWWFLQPISPFILWGGWGSIILLHAIYGLWVGDLFHSRWIQKREQEKEISGMKKEPDAHAILLERCAQFTDFINQGRELDRRSNETRSNFPDKDIENWLNEFEKYVGTLSSMHQSEWKKEHKNESIRANAYPSRIGENHKLYDTFTSRLIQSEIMLTRWREQSEQHGFVQRETNSTIP